MKKLLILLLPLQAFATNYYTAPGGSDSGGSGTFASPWKTLTKAATVMAAKPSKGAGDTVFVRGGTYGGAGYWPNTPANGYAQMLINGVVGTSTTPVVFINYPGEVPIYNFTGVVPEAPRTSPTALSIFSSSWFQIIGLRFTYYDQIASGVGVSRGVELNGCTNGLIKQCRVDHFQGTGFFISGTTFDCTYLNCDSDHNEDPLSSDGGGPGTDAWDNADGFGITGVGNTSSRITFEGCRAWLNSDDGWDNFGTDSSRIWKNCWAFLNGYYQRVGMPVPLAAGNGQGFKLGPLNTAALGTSNLRNLYNCVAFYNRQHGFDQNGEVTTRMTLLNCTAYHNGGYGYQFQYYPVSPSTIFHTIKNCAALDNMAGNVNLASANPANVTNNSWQSPITISSADFQTLDSTGCSGARAANGALPILRYLHLTSTSDLINAGTPVGLPYIGAAPDIGAYEYSSGPLPSRFRIVGYKVDGSEFRWESFEEQNLVYYAVQRSRDGIKWENVGKKLAKGPSLYIMKP